MVSLTLKDINCPPKKLLSDNAVKQLRRALKDKNGELYTSNYYRDAEVISLLKAYSLHKSSYKEGDFGKCSYCETLATPGVQYAVDHFRPKAKISPKDCEDPDNKGYYWLGIEWSNLILACPVCNGKSAKGTRFPIRGKRMKIGLPIDSNSQLDRSICVPDYIELKDEDALLINPEREKPEDYFSFDSTAKIIATGSDTTKANMSIEVYNLNRPDLVKQRLKLWDECKKNIMDEIAFYELQISGLKELQQNLKKIFIKLIKKKSLEQEYALWGRFVNNNINSFISEIDNRYQCHLTDAYNVAQQMLTDPRFSFLL